MWFIWLLLLIYHQWAIFYVLITFVIVSIPLPFSLVLIELEFMILTFKIKHKEKLDILLVYVLFQSFISFENIIIGILIWYENEILMIFNEHFSQRFTLNTLFCSFYINWKFKFDLSEVLFTFIYSNIPIKRVY